MVITDFASQNNGDWTNAFQAAIGLLEKQGGGELRVPAGVFFTGPIRLRSNITLYLEAGAVLRFHADSSKYPLMDGEFEGICSQIYSPCLYAENAKNVRIAGDGTIDGNGAAWWQAKREGTLQYPRPYLICFRECDRVAVEGVQLVNSPCWTIHPLHCYNVTVHGVSIINPADSPNTDGINPNGCSHVRITDCTIDVGDDCIAIKAGTEDTPNRRPCENIVIANCIMAHGHGGVVIGSEMSGDVRNVVVTGCIMKNTDRGIRIKTRRGRGGTVENLQFSNIAMDHVICPFVVNMYYCCGEGGRCSVVRERGAMPVSMETPRIRDIRISHVDVSNASACAGFILGLPEQPIERLSISDCVVTLRCGEPDYPAMLEDAEPMEAAGFFLRNACQLSLKHVTVVGQKGAELNMDESVSMSAEAL